jgi:hypothetical protein
MSWPLEHGFIYVTTHDLICWTDVLYVTTQSDMLNANVYVITQDPICWTRFYVRHDTWSELLHMTLCASLHIMWFVEHDWLPHYTRSDLLNVISFKSLYVIWFVKNNSISHYTWSYRFYMSLHITWYVEQYFIHVTTHDLIWWTWFYLRHYTWPDLLKRILYPTTHTWYVKHNFISHYT